MNRVDFWSIKNIHKSKEIPYPRPGTGFFKYAEEKWPIETRLYMNKEGYLKIYFSTIRAHNLWVCKCKDKNPSLESECDPASGITKLLMCLGNLYFNVKPHAE